MTHTVQTPQDAPSDGTRWAAEEIALERGWLRECPYHGEPFKAAGLDMDDTRCGATNAADANAELLQQARRLVSTCAEYCPACAHEAALLD